MQGVTDWVLTYDLTVTTAAPPAANSEGILARRASAYIIELETMRIRWRHDANFAGIGDSAALVGINELRASYLNQ